MSVALVLISLVVGVLIGAVGIGGVLLVPSLSLVAGLSVHEAIPACMLSYLATGAVGVIIYARHGSIQWSMVGWLCIGAVPAAYLGSISLSSIPPAIVLLIIALLMIFAGMDALIKSGSGASESHSKSLSKLQLIVIGVVTGFGSAITGTGGPLIIVPLIMFLGLPILTAIGLSQAIQIPIATFASIGNWVAGSLNLSLSLTIALSMIAGSLVGANMIHRLPKEPIRKGVAVLLVLVGTGIGVRLVLQYGGF